MYVDLADYLSSTDTDYSKVSTAVSNLEKISKGYSELAKGVSKLSAELEKIDMEKLTALRSLTGSIILMSLMDSDQFKEMMDALEDKAKILLDVIKDTEASAKESATTATPAAGGKVGGGAKVNTTPVKASAPKESESDKMMKQLIGSLSGLQSAVSQIAGVVAGGSGVSLKTYMESKMKTEKKSLGS
jgi:hypothetical protein